ncbi:MAG TPA: ABC transporter ATP-binding protein [Rhodopila sp.]|uniref:ABC transporter ATP-binding protein n=1 Tax=Rhodopila sp. TaxID=2480087 RepID=UPI002CDBF115|nr:ABC transporter ATP-binding protein [Rhodopila sp.]HVY16352.1 ABC transporter ATP-binding protein [Rhodopila sp.]
MLLHIDGLWVRYGGITALSGISIDVPEGETVLLVGANGAGKSSTINAVIGLVPAAQGRILLDDVDITRIPCERRARMGIGYSPEGRRVFPTMSVTDNVLTGAFGLGRRRQAEALDWLRSVFPLLAERAEQPAGQLSGGQQQIVAISRAMASLPRLLLLDEPFLGLAPVWIRQISDAILQLRARGTTVLMTEQMARPALKLATSGYVMRGGEVRRSGPVDAIRDLALAEEYL